MFFCVNSGISGVLTLVNRCMFMFVEIQFESLKGQACLINSPWRAANTGCETLNMHHLILNIFEISTLMIKVRERERERPHPDYHCYSWHWHLTESVIHEKDPVMAWGLKRSHRHWVYTWPDPEPGVCIIMGSSLNVNSNILDQKFIQYQGLVMRESSFYEYFRADSSLRETPAFGHNLDPWI